MRITLQISPEHHKVVQGPSKMNLQHISRITGTNIEFPNTNGFYDTASKHNIVIRGNLDGVIQARFMLMVFI